MSDNVNKLTQARIWCPNCMDGWGEEELKRGECCGKPLCGLSPVEKLAAEIERRVQEDSEVTAVDVQKALGEYGIF